jgi:hypothetical protein
MARAITLERGGDRMSVKRLVLPGLGLLAAGAIGFSVSPRPTRTRTDAEPRMFEGKLELPDDLPERFVRYAHAMSGDPIPAFDSVTIRGRARMRPVPGGPWLHTRMATHHLLGRAFAAEFAITWFGMPFLRAADAYMDGHGVVERFGWRPAPATELDLSAAMFMWLEAGMFPQSWGTPGLTFRQIDDLTLELGVPDADDVITWRLDPLEGLPVSVEAPRYREVGGPKLPWRAELGPFRDHGGVRWWSSAAAIWGDQDEPWLEWAIDRVEPGAAVRETIARHRPRR